MWSWLRIYRSDKKINTSQFSTHGVKSFSFPRTKGLNFQNISQYKWQSTNAMFFLRKMDRESQAVQQSAADGQKVSHFSARFYHILDVVTSNGEYEKTLQVNKILKNVWYRFFISVWWFQNLSNNCFNGGCCCLNLVKSLFIHFFGKLLLCKMTWIHKNLTTLCLLLKLS